MKTYRIILSGSFWGFILLISSTIVPLEHANAVLSQGDLSNTQTLNSADSATRAGLLKQYGNIPLHFEANRGQTDEKVRFISRGHGYNFFLTDNEAVLGLNVPEKKEKVRDDVQMKSGNKENDSLAAVVRMSLIGSSPHAEIAGLEKLPVRVNYFIGNDPGRWRTNVPTYKKVLYRDVYPGIDLLYYGKQGSLEYDLMVNPGGNHERIKIAFSGINTLEINEHGDLLLHISSGDIILKKPIIYQKIDGINRKIDGGYVLRNTREVSFRVADYDTNVPLIIDPTITYSTYLGG